MSGISEFAMCSWLHTRLDPLRVCKFPFDKRELPEKGIYFFYEKSEESDHGNGVKPRIVRIGTHKKNHFRSRILEHFIENQSKINFNQFQPKPSDRSIFRKNLGRAILNRDKNDYLKIWEIDFTTRANRIKFASKRIIEFERVIEDQISKLLRDTFSFRCIDFEDEVGRIGSQGIESRFIGCVARCKVCKPSQSWLGKYSPKPEICNGKLWLSRGLKSAGLNEKEKEILDSAIN